VIISIRELGRSNEVCTQQKGEEQRERCEIAVEGWIVGQQRYGKKAKIENEVGPEGAEP
jgi:hypothetical protein